MRTAYTYTVREALWENHCPYCPLSTASASRAIAIWALWISAAFAGGLLLPFLLLVFQVVHIVYYYHLAKLQKIRSFFILQLVFLHDFLETPCDSHHSLKRFSSAIVIRIVQSEGQVFD